MSARKPSFFRRTPAAYPHFGGRPVRASLAAHPATVALALLAAIAAGALSLPSSAGTVAHAPAAHGEVRTTDKSDRLKPALILEEGCDGVWGNEPLECLAQTA